MEDLEQESDKNCFKSGGRLGSWDSSHRQEMVVLGPGLEEWFVGSSWIPDTFKDRINEMMQR